MKKIIKLGVIVNKCLVCNVDFNPFVDFGSMPIANAFSSKEELQNEYTFDMKVGFCENCNMVQLVEQPFHTNYSLFKEDEVCKFFIQFLRESFQKLIFKSNSFEIFLLLIKTCFGLFAAVG